MEKNPEVKIFPDNFSPIVNYLVEEYKFEIEKINTDSYLDRGLFGDDVRYFSDEFLTTAKLKGEGKIPLGTTTVELYLGILIERLDKTKEISIDNYKTEFYACMLNWKTFKYVTTSSEKLMKFLNKKLRKYKRK